ncbi:LCP family protein [Streptomyces sp. NPDC088354]|uniref:LCP family protein n=1 Tax=unclassified Streptomyces TaxID=2593676 RepID=UPI0029B17EB1|nr:LCP family protein [Streptomyces sp. MI02-7b]MDX3074780.1 LCP family protein [Streptomyces sp. MI02-7b]
MTTPADSPESKDTSPGAAPPTRQRRRRWPRVLAGVTALAVLSGAGVAWHLYRQLDGNIHTDTDTSRELLRVQSERPSALPQATSAENILLLGSDNRGDGNGKYGQDTGTQRSDTAILLHLAADRKTATAVSLPRDLMVDIPSCRRPDGSMSRAQFAQFNWAFEFGGAACTIRTVEKLTGIRVDHHLVVDFSGFKKMVDAVGGVEVCVPHKVHDEDAHLDLKAGRQVLHGEDALGYVRARHGIGDGSDTQRIDRQQEFLASLVKKVDSTGVLLNPTKLYPLLDAATSSLTADPGLDSLRELYDLTQTLRRTPAGQVRFLTVPRRPWVQDPNRDELVQPEAKKLFTTLREDGTVAVQDDGASPRASNSPTPGGTTSTASASPSATGAATDAPSYRGTTADRDVCGGSGD